MTWTNLLLCLSGSLAAMDMDRESPLSEWVMTPRKSPSPFICGERERSWEAIPPAVSPIRVTRSGSPPKEAMLARTQRRASNMSRKPWDKLISMKYHSALHSTKCSKYHVISGNQWVVQVEVPQR